MVEGIEGLPSSGDMERIAKAMVRESRAKETMREVERSLPLCKVCEKEIGRPVYDGKCEDCWVEGTETKCRIAKAKPMRDVIPTASVGVRLR